MSAFKLSMVTMTRMRLGSHKQMKMYNVTRLSYSANRPFWLWFSLWHSNRSQFFWLIEPHVRDLGQLNTGEFTEMAWAGMDSLGSMRGKYNLNTEFITQWLHAILNCNRCPKKLYKNRKQRASGNMRRKHQETQGQKPNSVQYKNFNSSLMILRMCQSLEFLKIFTSILQ